jgi:hypothetical protein
MELHVWLLERDTVDFVAVATFIVCGSQFSYAIDLLRNVKYQIFESCLKLE